MKTKSLFSRSEAVVDSIISQALQGSGFRAFPSVRLSDILMKDVGEYLPPAEFDFLTRAHIDFVIATDVRSPLPVFGIEFDGPHHKEHRQRERDILKNRLCKSAGFPLLRIGADDIRRYEEVDLLTHMLDRFLSWDREYPSIMRHIEQVAQEVSPETLERWCEEGDPFLDPHFHFDCAHPFPGLKRVLARFSASGVALAQQEVKAETQFLASVTPVCFGSTGDDQFWGARHRVIVRDLTKPGRGVIVEVEREVAIRSWLPLDTFIPCSIPSLFEAKSTKEIDEISALLERRIKGMWVPCIPGISPSGIAESFSEYLALRAAEELLLNAEKHYRGDVGQPQRSIG